MALCVQKRISPHEKRHCKTISECAVTYPYRKKLIYFDVLEGKISKGGRNFTRSTSESAERFFFIGPPCHARDSSLYDANLILRLRKAFMSLEHSPCFLASCSWQNAKSHLGLLANCELGFRYDPHTERNATPSKLIAFL